MSEAFRPIGERARWRMIYDLMREAEDNDLVSYEQMATLLELHPVRDRHLLQMAARRAGIELEKVDRRAADAVRGQGYRVVQPREILGLGQRRNRKAGKQIDRGIQITQAVDLNLVDAETRKALETLARGFAQQGDINRGILLRQQRHDELFASMREEIDEIKQKMEAQDS